MVSISELSFNKELFFYVTCAMKPSSCRCVLASDKYSASVEVLAM